MRSFVSDLWENSTCWRNPLSGGIKCFSLADSSNGYILPYTLDKANFQYQALPQPAQVVLHHLEPYLDQGWHVFTDWYYTSIPMAQMPRRCGTTFTRTVVKNRAYLPNEIRGRFWLGNDEVMAFRDGDLVALAWRAAKKQQRVLMLSTECSARLVMFQHVSLTLSHRQSRLLYILVTSRWMEWT